MLTRLYLLLSVFFVPLVLEAQQGTKTTQNIPLPNIDYKQIGAPMPTLYMRAYHDSSAANRREKTKKEKRRKRNAAPVSDTINTELYSTVTNDDLDNGANLILMLFNPTCGHCEDMTFMMEKNIAAFKKSKVVLLATKPMAPYLPDFAERHHIARYPAMYIGYDSTNFVDNMFLYQSLPQINIYDRKRKLLKTFTGEVPADTLMKFIE